MDNWNNRIIGYVTKPASQLAGNPRNPRKHPQKQRDAVKGSLDTLGWIAPVVENIRTGYLIDGHERVMQALGISDDELVPVIQVDLDESEEAQALATFDFITYMAEYDRDNLKSLIDEVSSDNINIQSLIDEIAVTNKIIASTKEVENTEDVVDKAEELNKKWQVQKGDVWHIGVHRLMCGDSSKQEDVLILFDGDKSDLVVTDPPYGVAIGDKNKFLNSFQKAGMSLENIANDALDVDSLKALLTNVFTVTKSFMNDCSACYVTAPQGGDLNTMMMMMQDAGLKVRHILIWVKNSPTFSMNRLDYDYQHEPIFYTWNKTHKYYGYGQHKTSVWFVDKPRSSKEHPTMKPIELFENAILNSTERGMIVHDPFSGSGTTGIACEKTGRIARMMELEPRFCAVILERMELLGLEPKLISRDE